MEVYIGEWADYYSWELDVGNGYLDLTVPEDKEETKERGLPLGDSHAR